MAEETNPRLYIALPRYEGPFDLLLAMVRRNEWSIEDVPITEITRQFLAYLQASQEVDAELGGEFVEVASWLVLLKSRSLLPSSEGPAPREELRRALLDHATLATATGLLRERGERARLGPGGAPIGRRDTVLAQPTEEGPTVEDVLTAVRLALETARAAASLENTAPENATVTYQARWVLDTLSALPPRTPVSTAEWFATQPSNSAQVALFLALLELARQGMLLLHQSKEFAPLRVKACGTATANMGS